MSVTKCESSRIVPTCGTAKDTTGAPQKNVYWNALAACSGTLKACMSWWGPRVSSHTLPGCMFIL